MTAGTAVGTVQGQGSLLDIYRQHRPTGYDELLDAAGQLRPHWQPLLAQLELCQ